MPAIKDLQSSFDEELSAYQQDLTQIISHYRHPNHHLGVDEILSEVNLSLLRNRDKIIDSCTGAENIFMIQEFRKISFGYARRSVGWVQGRLNRSSYISRRSNESFENEDGVSTSFDIACENLAKSKELEVFSLDNYNKCASFIKTIKRYSSMFTDREYEVFILREGGKNLREIANVLGVTHQAISITEANIRDKITSFIKIDPFSDNSSAEIADGARAINSLFTTYNKFTDSDRKDLRNLLLNSFKKYTSLEISKFFKGGKFTHRQIASFCSKKKLGPYLKKICPNAYSSAEEIKMIKMIEEGASIEDLVTALSRSRKSVSSKITHLMREKVISRRP